jgi:hypothetical protein
MRRPTLAAPTTHARQARHPEPRRAARRLAITSMVLAAAVYLLGWAGPEPEIFRVLNVLGLVTALCALGLESTSFLVGAAVASTVAASVGLGDLPRLDGAGILAVMCSVLAAATIVGAGIAWSGHTGWLPPTLFPLGPRPPETTPHGPQPR